MQHNTTLHNTAHHDAAKHNAAQHTTPPHHAKHKTYHNATPYHTTYRNATQHNTPHNNTTQHAARQHDTPQHITTQRDALTRTAGPIKKTTTSANLHKHGWPPPRGANNSGRNDTTYENNMTVMTRATSGMYVLHTHSSSSWHATVEQAACIEPATARTGRGDIANPI